MKGKFKNTSKLKKRNLKSYKKEFDKIYSEYIRLKDADEYGYAQCVTCGTRKHWKNMQAGHYEKRDHLPNRFNDENVHVQCEACNFWGGGAYPKYARYLISKYGAGHLEKLAMRNNENIKYSIPDYQELIAEYREKVEALKVSINENR